MFPGEVPRLIFFLRDRNLPFAHQVFHVAPNALLAGQCICLNSQWLAAWLAGTGIPVTLGGSPGVKMNYSYSSPAIPMATGQLARPHNRLLL